MTIILVWIQFRLAVKISIIQELWPWARVRTITCEEPMILACLVFSVNCKRLLHSTGFLNYTSVLSNSVILLHETPFQIINMYSIGGHNWASELLVD